MYLLSFPTLITATLTLFLPLLVWIRAQKISQNHQKAKGELAPPEPSGALPLIGHLHLLGAQIPLAHTLASFADKYGPIFTIRLGAFPALVVSSQDAIKECFTTNDKTLAARPKSSHGVYLNYNYASFGSAPDGPYWRKLKKLIMVELLSARRLASLRHAYESEIDFFIGDLYSYVGDNNKRRVVIISEWLERLTLNIITRMIAGKRYCGNLQDVEDEESRRVLKLIKDFMHISGEFVPSDLIPFLGWFPGEGKVLRSMKKIARDLDYVASSWVEEHWVKKKESRSEEQDFVDFMLSVIEDDDDTLGHARDTIIKANVLSLILAGADTTSISLTWTIALLLNNKHVLKRAQEEIDRHVGKQRWVQISDVKNLTYLEAIFKETLRLYPPGPLLVPHEATQDCYISGYYVPKGTRVFANIWKLHRDPTIWSQPEKFMPERFVTEENNNNNNGEIDYEEGHSHFQYLPFGFGRRACPGSTFAMQVSMLSLARLLQGFELKSVGDEPVDMKEGASFTLPKATPLEIIPTPRLSSHLYHL